MIWERNGGNITFISKRKEYACNYFYLLISRIIRLNCRRGGSGAGWKTMFFLLQMVTIKHLQKYQKESHF